MEDAQAWRLLPSPVAQACPEPVEGVHLRIDAETLDIRAIEVTTNAIGDAPTLPALLAQIPQDEQILSVGGDGADDARACNAAIAEHRADAVMS